MRYYLWICLSLISTLIATLLSVVIAHVRAAAGGGIGIPFRAGLIFKAVMLLIEGKKWRFIMNYPAAETAGYQSP